jgi:hypothetical protein
MGFFSGIGSFISSAVDTIGSIFGGGSSSSSNHNSSSNSNSNTEIIYEPDKVKITQLENDRMEKAVIAQKEIMEMNHNMQLMIMEANQKGFENSSNILKELTISLNKIAQDRLILIENGHFEVVQKIENLYMQLEKEIRDDNTSFNLNELPEMLKMLDKFDKDSSSYDLYSKSIKKQMNMNMSFFAQKLSALHERQRMMVESSIKSKDLILEQSSQIVSQRMKFLEQQLQEQYKLPMDNKIKYLESN